ncbi:hypothetical protein DMENIID0001_171060 [Sergentomyia squamirostris]
MAKKLSDTVYPDVTFVFPNDGGSTFATRKFELSRSSEVFAKMFASGLETDRIIIEDITICSFDKMIRHLNGEEILEACSYVYNNIMDAKSLLRYYPDIKKFNLTYLNHHITNLCIRIPKDIIDNMNINCDDHLEILKIILECEYLLISEFNLYGTIMKMIKRTSGDLTWDEVKGKLGKLIYLIRFPTMTVDELVMCAKRPSLLTGEQMMNLMLYAKEKMFTETIELFPKIHRRINSNLHAFLS